MSHSPLVLFLLSVLFTLGCMAAPSRSAVYTESRFDWSPSFPPSAAQQSKNLAPVMYIAQGLFFPADFCKKPEISVRREQP